MAEIFVSRSNDFAYGSSGTISDHRRDELGPEPEMRLCVLESDSGFTEIVLFSLIDLSDSVFA